MPTAPRHATPGRATFRRRAALAGGLLGFALGGFFDGILLHQVLQWHHLAFGLAVLVAGFWLRRPPGGGTRAGATVALTLAIAVTLAGPMAARPPADATTVLALFPADTPPTQVFGAAAAADARLVWSDPYGTAGRQGLYRHGALLVSGGVLAAACLDWTLP